MRILLAGAAAVALVTSGALAQPGNANGFGNGKDRASAKMERGQPDRARDRDNRGRADIQVQRRNDERQERQRERTVERRLDRVNGAKRVSDTTGNREVRRKIEGNPINRGLEQLAKRRDSSKRLRDSETIIDTARYVRERNYLSRDRDRRLIAGCPPGLARKRNGCLPPGQTSNSNSRNQRWNGYSYSPALFGLSNYDAGRYLFEDGYLLRPASSGGIAGYIPLLGGALSIGNLWPSSYQSYAVPDYYVDYYDLGPDTSYRYADNVIYRVDPSDAAITSVAALLTGDEFVIGQPMPSGYDVYNVPYTYRDRYADSPEALYRYSDGYVYRIDPESRLIAAAIDLLA